MADPRSPLLYLVHRIPYPPNKGDKVRSFNILRQLARRYRVFLGTFVDHPDDVQHIDTLGQWCEKVHVVRLQPMSARLASLRGLLTGEALSLPYYRDAGLARWVNMTVASEGIKSAVAFSGPMAQYLPATGLERRVIDFCDVDSAKWAQYSADRRWPMSWLYRREGQRLAAFEREAASASDASLFVTDAEAALFTRDAPLLGSRVRTMQNGVDAEYFSPSHRFDSPYPAGGPILVFTGAMDYWPNIDAATWFARDILPLVRAQLPDIRFWIVGMNPSPAVLALAGESVFVTGTVPDVRPYLAHADIVVAPLRIARGIQNKVLEAMAMARPVVVADAAAQGLEAVSGQDCEIAHNAEAFVSRIVALLEDRESCQRMSLAARDCVLSHYSWTAHLAVLDDCLCLEQEGSPSIPLKCPDQA